MKMNNLLRGLSIIGLIASLIQIVSSYPTVFAAENLDRYWSVLTGHQQIPPVNTSAVGFIGLKFENDVSQLVYIVNVENIGNVTGINLYQGAKNKNGTLVLDLLNGTRELRKNVDKLVDVSSDGIITGTLAIGGATKEDLQGSLKGKSLADLNQSIVTGMVYANIETKEFPSGEIRGDAFVPIDRIFPDFNDFEWN
jgi:CHRD domain-containing protein